MIQVCRRIVVGFLFLASVTQLFSQAPKSYHPGDIQQMLNKLNVLGTALYVAAHPDDENTRLIAYLSNEKLLRTAYLSATRGDGGQNLIGTEIREGLGIIRTQELLGARRIDGGKQFFSRANDFGYSKHPDETLKVWDKDQVLSDFVRVIRQFKPDMLITRFDTTAGVTHGHHTTSALLALEAFELAADPNAFPEQLSSLSTWQPTKIFRNASWWSFRRSGQKMDTSAFKSVDVGLYNPLIGTSYTEMAARSRSQHKSQGFGSTGSRGSEIEYLKQWNGIETEEVFGGMDFTWSRVENSQIVADYVDLAIRSYDPLDPQPTLDALYQARAELLKLPDQFWKEVKLEEIDNVVLAITGTYLEVVAEDYLYTRGDTMMLKMEAITRSEEMLVLEEVRITSLGESQQLSRQLINNKGITEDILVTVPDDQAFSSPYWLNGNSSLGMYYVSEKDMIGLPENPVPFTARFLLKWKEQFIEIERPISFKRNDPVDGEVFRPIVILPKATVTIAEEAMIFSGEQTKRIVVRVKSSTANVNGILKIAAPKGWQVVPDSEQISLEVKNQEAVIYLQVTSSVGANNGDLKAYLDFEDGSSNDLGIQIISYDHIPTQTILSETKTKLINLDMKIVADRIGYIMGAGDVIPDNLRQVGYQVDELEKDDVTLANLAKYDAIVLGVRAFNTKSWLAFKNTVLFDYAKSGGTVIVQYNTNSRLVTNEIAPYELTISRERVTVEEAEVRILAPKHAVLNYPNKISSEDFEGWVQERGLYFSNSWADEFEPILSSNDPGEPARDGGLLIAKHGKGYYVYTGYSWFRELPAGVPGAYRIFSNLLSLSKK
ncbi:MAG: LmbE family N-acetylglucosaminyl deacetylase [Cyclobacteriaceae bacterium]|jgi:LmbE family N-acetylglucosaminyl deacetylase